MKKPIGPIDVNGEITPISHEKVRAIDSTKWEDMSITELMEQREILSSRINMIPHHQIGLVAAANQGLATIDAIVKTKYQASDSGLI